MSSTINITSQTIVDRLSEFYCDCKYPELRGEDKSRALPSARYNLMVHALHAGTALLVGAVALALLAKFSAALVFGTVGYLLHKEMALQTARELENRFIRPTEPATRLVMFGMPLIRSYVPDYHRR